MGGGQSTLTFFTFRGPKKAVKAQSFRANRKETQMGVIFLKLVHIKKLFKNRIASVRDYLVSEAIAAGETLRLIYVGQYMDLTPDELLTKQFKLTKFSFTSKYNSKPYRLIDYEWIPDGQVETSKLFKETIQFKEEIGNGDR
jgi:hypothetical protein